MIRKLCSFTENTELYTVKTKIFPIKLVRSQFGGEGKQYCSIRIADKDHTANEYSYIQITQKNRSVYITTHTKAAYYLMYEALKAGAITGEERLLYIDQAGYADFEDIRDGFIEQNKYMHAIAEDSPQLKLIYLNEVRGSRVYWKKMNMSAPIRPISKEELLFDERNSLLICDLAVFSNTSQEQEKKKLEEQILELSGQSTLVMFIISQNCPPERETSNILTSILQKLLPG